MQITIFGAAGKVGRLTTERALAEEHTVIAFVHSQNPFAETKNLIIRKGDVHNPDDVVAAIEGSQAVISCLGSWHTKQKDILSAAMQTVIPAMDKQGIKRIITLTGAAAFDKTDALSLAQKIGDRLFGLVAHKIVADGGAHLKLLQTSDLDWTVIRSPVMKNSHEDTYQLRMTFPGLFDRISRRAVAKCLVDQLEATDNIRRAPIIYAA